MVAKRLTNNMKHLAVSADGMPTTFGHTRWARYIYQDVPGRGALLEIIPKAESGYPETFFRPRVAGEVRALAGNAACSRRFLPLESGA